jgi:hypothetical protein
MGLRAILAISVFVGQLAHAFERSNQRLGLSLDALGGRMTHRDAQQLVKELKNLNSHDSAELKRVEQMNPDDVRVPVERGDRLGREGIGVVVRQKAGRDTINPFALQRLGTKVQEGGSALSAAEEQHVHQQNNQEFSEGHYRRKAKQLPAFSNDGTNPPMNAATRSVLRWVSHWGKTHDLQRSQVEEETDAETALILISLGIGLGFFGIAMCLWDAVFRLIVHLANFGFAPLLSCCFEKQGKLRCSPNTLESRQIVSRNPQRPRAAVSKPSVHKKPKPKKLTGAMMDTPIIRTRMNSGEWADEVYGMYSGQKSNAGP